MAKTLENMVNRLRRAIAFYWQTREQQRSKQTLGGQSDQGARSAVTGGAQMSGLNRLLTDLILKAGARPEDIFHKKALELPAFFVRQRSGTCSWCENSNLSLR